MKHITELFATPRCARVKPAGSRRDRAAVAGSRISSRCARLPDRCHLSRSFDLHQTTASARRSRKVGASAEFVAVAVCWICGAVQHVIFPVRQLPTASLSSMSSRKANHARPRARGLFLTLSEYRRPSSSPNFRRRSFSQVRETPSSENVNGILQHQEPTTAANAGGTR